ncbi:MAG: hypothetical protein ACTS5G_04355, partial [Burkholderiales bacterium]
MNGIPQGGGIHAAQSAATVPQERRGGVPHSDITRTDATVLTLTGNLTGKSALRSSQPGLAALYTLLQGSRSAELSALPPRTTQLLLELSRHLLPVRDLSSNRLRNLVLANGGFLESSPPQEEASVSDASGPRPLTDLKSLLGQLLALMQPGRQLALRNGNLQFISLNPGTAQCLQAYAEEQK